VNASPPALNPPDVIERPPRFNVLGAGVHALDLGRATQLVVSAARARLGGYVCFCDVNSASNARRDPLHRSILNRSFLTTPDGMPVVWMGRRQGFTQTKRVYGPDLLLATLCATENTELTHFFYGAGEGTAEMLAKKLQSQFPGIRIAGTYCPPFRNLNEQEARALHQQMGGTKPSFLWVGLSTPKQERFMAEHSSQWDVGLSLGVGAAFDFLSGRVRQAPLWAQRNGAEWLWRLCHEPRRLAPRYFRNNPAFVLRALGQLCGLKSYSLD
jgi:N-acetylglucosaminyldiphosphoundecaprenol N-acetyl-beta-D-mannosaminyltransferase